MIFIKVLYISAVTSPELCLTMSKALDDLTIVHWAPSKSMWLVNIPNSYLINLWSMRQLRLNYIPWTKTRWQQQGLKIYKLFQFPVIFSPNIKCICTSWCLWTLIRNTTLEFLKKCKEQQPYMRFLQDVITYQSIWTDGE